MTFKLEGLRASTFTDEVFATGEGYTVENQKKAIALPSRAALKKFVRLTLPSTGLSTLVQVLDVGPYFWWDHSFIDKGTRPLVEWYHKQGIPFPSEDVGKQYWSKVSFAGKVPNSRASVDLTPPVWRDLGIMLSEKELRSFSVDDLMMEWFIGEPSKLEELPEWLRI